MKGVMLEVSREELARRRLIGLDRWDEMWEGVLHMAPAPSYERQRIVDELIAFFLPLLKRGQTWVTSQVLGARFRPVAGPHLAVEDLADAALHAEI